MPFKFLKKKVPKRFDVVGFDRYPVSQYIPMNKILRDRLYREYDGSATLPSYGSYEKHIRPELLMLMQDFRLKFIFGEDSFDMLIKKGTIWDGSSVPSLLEFGKVKRMSQYSLIASLVHDTNFSNAYFSFEEANEIFEGLLYFNEADNFTVFVHMLGLKLFGRSRYNKAAKLGKLVGFSTLKRVNLEDL